MRYEMKKVFETIEPSSIERQNMLTNIFAQSLAGAKQERKQSNFFARRIMALAASLVLVIGVSAVGLRLLANDNYNAGAGGDFDGAEIEPPTPAEIINDKSVYMSKCGIIIGEFDSETYWGDYDSNVEPVTVSYNDVKKLTIDVTNTIVVVFGTDTDDVVIHYNSERYYGTNYFEDEQRAHFASPAVIDVPVTIMTVLVPNDLPLEIISISTNSGVLIENVNADRLNIIDYYGDASLNGTTFSFNTVILNSHFDVANIQANADVVTVKDSSFLGLYPKIIGEIGFYYNNINDDENNVITFENSKATGLYADGNNTTVNVSNSELGQFIQDARHDNSFRNTFANITNSTIEDLLLLNSYGNTTIVTDSEIKYLVALGAYESQVKFDGADVSVFGFKSEVSTVENVIVSKRGTGIYKDGELIPLELYNVVTGELQGDIIIPEGSTRSTRPEHQTREPR